MNCNIATAFGSRCGNGFDDCFMALAHDSPSQLPNEVAISYNNRLSKFQKSAKNFYMLLEGDIFINYGNSSFTPISSPYESNAEWTDYIDQWNYDQNFIVKMTLSTIFLSVICDEEVSKVRILPINEGSTSLQVKENSTLLIVKRNKVELSIDSEVLSSEIINFTKFYGSHKEVNVNSNGKAYIVNLIH